MKLRLFGREVVLKKEVVVIGAAVLLLLGCLIGYIFFRGDSDIIIEAGADSGSTAATGSTLSVGQDGAATGSGGAEAPTGSMKAPTPADGTVPGAETANDTGQVPETIRVYVVGCVKKPGIVTIKKGQLIDDAVRAAGGLTAEADAEHINLVYSLNENVMLHIKSKQNVGQIQGNTPKQAAAGKQGTSGNSTTGNTAAVKAAAGTAGNPGTAGNTGAGLGNGAEISEDGGSGVEIAGEGVSGESGTAEAGGVKNLVNINTADAAELDTLPGVGEATARDIIAFREKNGKFTRIEDIMKVPRIKQSRFDSIKDYITAD